MIEILIGAIALFFVLALVIISRNKYVQWLERKLATTRKDFRQLRNDVRGTVTEYDLQKRIVELEAMVRWQQPWLTRATTEYHLQKRITELKKENNEWFHKGYAKASKFVDQLEASIANLVIDRTKLETENDVLIKRIKALEAHVPKSVLRRLDAQIK